MKTTTQFLRITLAAAACAMACAVCAAADAGAQTKDIVLDRINSRMPGSAVATTTQTVNDDAMVVSVLLESRNGALKPRSTNGVFTTGERFRVKMRASRDGKVALYNTKPTGELVSTPLWRGEVSRGLEIITPRLRLEGKRGTDQLHIVLEPVQEAGGVSWLGNWLQSPGKDIRLDVQNTSSDTYLLGNAGKGLVTTLRITHR